MTSSNFLFPEGNSINRPPIFNGEGYHYWKTHMQIFIEAIDLNIWEAIEIGPFIPTMVVGNKTIEKPRDQWDEDERKRVQYNKPTFRTTEFPKKHTKKEDRQTNYLIYFIANSRTRV